MDGNASNMRSIADKGEVRIAALSVTFGSNDNKTTALASTNLVLEPGTFTALIGPSGCGKSTLLNAVAGFERPTEGVIHVDNRRVEGPHPTVGVIFQNFALFPWFTARGNVMFALKRRKIYLYMVKIGLQLMVHAYVTIFISWI